MATSITKVGEAQFLAPARLGLVISPEQAHLNNQVAVLIAILHGMTCEMLSPDSVYLSLARARSICEAAGIPDETISQVMDSFNRYSKEMRRRNPLSSLYE